MYTYLLSPHPDSSKTTPCAWDLMYFCTRHVFVIYYEFKRETRHLLNKKNNI